MANRNVTAAEQLAAQRTVMPVKVEHTPDRDWRENGVVIQYRFLVTRADGQSGISVGVNASEMAKMAEASLRTSVPMTAYECAAELARQEGAAALVEDYLKTERRRHG